MNFALLLAGNLCFSWIIILSENFISTEFRLNLTCHLNLIKDEKFSLQEKKWNRTSV
jgi:hypothetical protein